MMRIGVVVASLCLGSVGIHAETLPCSSIRIIVPFSAGGATDVTARLVAEPLGRKLSKTVVVENRPGATGNIGTAYVAKSKPDGCTLVVNVAAILTYQWVFADLGYDPAKDLVAIGAIGRSPSLILTSASSPLTDLKGLVALSKKRPDGLTYATAGLGLMPHLAVEELAHISGAKFVPVFYKGAPDFMGDLIAGRVVFGSTAAANSMPLVRQNKLKALAVMQEKRSPLAPNIPSSAEQGMSHLDSSSHFMVFAPSGTPKETVDLLSTKLLEIVSDPAIGKHLTALGFDPSPIGAAECAKVVRRIGHDWEPIVKALHLNSK